MSDTIENEALNQLNNYLLLNRKLLKDFSNMPLLLEMLIDRNTQDLD